MPPVDEWSTFPFEGEPRPRRLQPPVARKRPRFGEGGVDCQRCSSSDDPYLWARERWRLWGFDRPTGLPVVAFARAEGPLRGAG